jgi:hypothetical protein
MWSAAPARRVRKKCCNGWVEYHSVRQTGFMTIQWPEFDVNGDLPPGIHRADLAEVLQYFGTGKE